MERLTIDAALEIVRLRLHLSKEAERDILDELRSHFETTVAEARARGEDEGRALEQALARLGGDQMSQELQAVHAGREGIEAIGATALPILGALILRWLVFVPEGTALAWRRLLVQPAFWLIAAGALLLPTPWLGRSRLALAGWAIFWALTVLFAVFPTVLR
jgi:hypothetical protein